MYMGNKGGVYDENYALCANDVMIMQTTGNKNRHAVNEC